MLPTLVPNDVLGRTLMQHGKWNLAKLVKWASHHYAVELSMYPLSASYCAAVAIEANIRVNTHVEWN